MTKINIVAINNNLKLNSKCFDDKLFSWDKMATMLADDILNCIFLYESDII